MLSSEDNELLCRVGRGTPMGDLAAPLLDAVPALERAARARRPAEEGAPARRGPDRVPRHAGRGRAARRPTARIAAPRSSSAATRSAGCAARTTAGSSTSPAAASTCRTSRRRAPSRTRCGRGPIPCRDVNGVIWTYMGPRETPPALPAFEINTLPAAQVYPPLMMLEECNWVQALEGDIDSSHIDFVHAKRSARHQAARAPFTGTSGRGSRCCRRTTARATRPGGARTSRASTGTASPSSSCPSTR